MGSFSGLLVTLELVISWTALAVRLDHAPGVKRVLRYETDDGDGSTPFEDPSAGATAAPSACRGCGTDLESPTARYCPSCFAPIRAVTDRKTDRWSGDTSTGKICRNIGPVAKK